MSFSEGIKKVCLQISTFSGRLVEKKVVWRQSNFPLSPINSVDWQLFRVRWVNPAISLSCLQTGYSHYLLGFPPFSSFSIISHFFELESPLFLASLVNLIRSLLYLIAILCGLLIRVFSFPYFQCRWSFLFHLGVFIFIVTHEFPNFSFVISFPIDHMSSLYKDH